MPDLKFSDGSHCHWSYRLGKYESFLKWPTRDDVETYLNEAGLMSNPVEVLIRHGNECTCEPSN